MKKITTLALLTLTLAACSQGTGTPAQMSGALRPDQQLNGTTYANTQAAYDALVGTDLQRLNSQVLAPQVYLNVLPVAGSLDSVRAYVKSTFASPATCDLTWNDGTASSVQSPTISRIQTLDHAYSTFGSRTITVRCLNGGTLVGTGSVTISAGRAATGSHTVINFDTPVAAPNTFLTYGSYQEKGFNFHANPQYGVYGISVSYYGQNTGPSQGLYTNSNSGNNHMTMESITGTPFTLNSVETRSFYQDQTEDLIITGHKVGGSTVSHLTHQIANGSAVETFDASWTDLTSVTFASPGTNGQTMIIDNVDVTLNNID